MIGQKTAYYRYLPETTGSEANPLGINILDGGYTLIPPGTPYPPIFHNKEHDFDTDSGRILSEHQLVYITRGSGEFESEQTGKISIKEGDLFLLFPGVWHRYAPRPQTGWDEYWIGFNGETARRLMQSPFFSLAEPVISVGHDDALLHLFIETVDALETESAGYPLLTAAWTVEIIARLRTLRQGGGRDSKMEALLRQACCRLQERADQNINIDLGFDPLRTEHCGSDGLSAGTNRIHNRERVGARNRYRSASRGTQGEGAHHRRARRGDRPTLSAGECGTGRCHCAERRGDRSD